MKIDRGNILKIFNSGLLLVPGFLYAVLSLVISSNRLFTGRNISSLFLLNIAQLLSLGVIISKYAADQMLLAKLNAFERVALRSFFIRRVLPLNLLFCFFLLLTHSLTTVLCLLICIPIEVFVIVVMFELNIAKEYFVSLWLNLIGYPLVFIIYIILSFFMLLTDLQILMIFVCSSVIKMILALKLRNKGHVRYDVLVLSRLVPFQQVGNYLLFKSDQFFIAINLIPSFFFRFSLPGDYLFYSKFTEIFSGVATSLGPVLVKFGKTSTNSISIVPFLRNKFYLMVTILAVLFQIVITLVFLNKPDLLHILLLIPFVLVTLLIIPVNMINYEFYRTNSILKSSYMYMIAIFIAALVMVINLYIKSVLLFAFIIPLQLAVYISINYYLNRRRDV